MNQNNNRQSLIASINRQPQSINRQLLTNLNNNRNADSRSTITINLPGNSYATRQSPYLIGQRSQRFNDQQPQQQQQSIQKNKSLLSTSEFLYLKSSNKSNNIQGSNGDSYKIIKLFNHNSNVLEQQNTNSKNSKRCTPSLSSYSPMSLVQPQQQQQQLQLNVVSMDSNQLVAAGVKPTLLLGKSHQFDHNNNQDSIRSMSSNDSNECSIASNASNDNPEVSRSVFCPLCDNSKSFCATSSVTRHLRSVHKLNDLFRTKNCYCLVCGLFAEDIETYYAHLKDQHQIVLQPSPAAQINPSLPASELIIYNKHFFDNFDEFLRWKTTQLELETGCQYEQCFTYDYPRSIYYKCAAITLHSNANHTNNNKNLAKSVKSGDLDRNNEHDYINRNNNNNNHQANNNNNSNDELALLDDANSKAANNMVSVTIDNKFDARMYPCTSSIRIIYHRSGIEARLLPIHLVHSLHSSPTKIILSTVEQTLIPSLKSSNSNNNNGHNSDHHQPPHSHNNNNNHPSNNTNSFKHQKITNSKLLSKNCSGSNNKPTTNCNNNGDSHNNDINNSYSTSTLNQFQQQPPQQSQLSSTTESSSKYSLSNVELPSDEEEGEQRHVQRLGLHRRTSNLSNSQTTASKHPYIQNDNDPSLNTTVSIVVPQSPSSFLNSPLSDPPSTTTQPSTTIFDESMLIISDNVDGDGHQFNDLHNQDQAEGPEHLQIQQQQLHQTTPSNSESTLSAYSDTHLPSESQDPRFNSPSLLHDSVATNGVAQQRPLPPLLVTTTSAPLPQFSIPNGHPQQQQNTNLQLQIVSLEKGLETVQESIRPRKLELREKFEQLLDACITESDIDLVEISLSSVSGHLLPNHFD